MGQGVRTENMKRNILWGYIAQIGVLLLSFIGRRLFLNYLSLDYLGINGLYTNVLQVLSLAELGMGTAITFSFYKPLTSNDEAYIRSLAKYAKKVYYCIALAVLAIGLALIPFLPSIINSDLPQKQFVLYYVLFLINSTLSYFVAHKVALISADQNNRLQKRVELGIALLGQVLHITVLVIWRNYTLYVIAGIVCTVVGNIALGAIVDRRYPYLAETGVNAQIDSAAIVKNVKATFFYKLGTVLMNSTDNILISTLISTAAVGLYSNYLVIVSAVQGFVSTVTNALLSAIGSLHAESAKSRMLEVFDVLLLLYHVVAAFGGVCFFLLFNDFIPIWLGQAYLLDPCTVFVIAFNFYLTNAVSPIWMFRESTGMFTKVKYQMLIMAFCNIVLSVLFGRIWGMFGILIASALSRIMTSFWYEPILLFRNVFGMGAGHYWGRQAKYLFCTLLSAACCWLIAQGMPHSLPFILIKGVLFGIITATVFFAVNFRTPEILEVRATIQKTFG